MEYTKFTLEALLRIPQREKQSSKTKFQDLSADQERYNPHMKKCKQKTIFFQIQTPNQKPAQITNPMPAIQVASYMNNSPYCAPRWVAKGIYI